MNDTTHHFDQSLNYEHTQFERANDYYRRLGATEIKRCDFKTCQGKTLQHEDIDAQICVKGRWINISEKHRTSDFGDLLIEVYSMYPDELSWIYKSKADLLFYFTPKNIYQINEKELKAFALEKLFPNAIGLDDFARSNQGFQRKNISIDGKNYPVNYIKARNESWNTISISVPFSMLDEFNATYSKMRVN